jgi:hypothetical protein
LLWHASILLAHETDEISFPPQAGAPGNAFLRDRCGQPPFAPGGASRGQSQARHSFWLEGRAKEGKAIDG